MGAYTLFLAHARIRLTTKCAKPDKSAHASAFVVPHKRLTFPEMGWLTAAACEDIARLEFGYNLVNWRRADAGQRRRRERHIGK